MDQVDVEEWLGEVLLSELDVRPPRATLAKERNYLSRTAHVTLYGQYRPAGHCELRRHGGALELATVIVDEEKRGIGLSHELVRIAMERAGQDPIITGQALGNFTPPLVFCFTKSAALATTLTKAGFKIQPARRRFSRLYLWKSASANLPLGVQISLGFERLFRYLNLLVKHRAKAKQQAGHLSEYHLFTRVAGRYTQRDGGGEMSGGEADDGGLLTSGKVTALGMDVVRVTDEDFQNEKMQRTDKGSTDQSLAWDEGE